MAAEQAASESLITTIMNQPEGAVAGLAAGYIIAKALAWKKQQNQNNLGI